MEKNIQHFQDKISKKLSGYTLDELVARLNVSQSVIERIKNDAQDLFNNQNMKTLEIKSHAIAFAKWLRENTVENDGKWLMRVEDTYTDEEIYQQYLKSLIQ